MEPEHQGTDKEKMLWRIKRREHRAMRLLTAVIVVVFVFWCGFEFGEIRATVGIGRGYGAGGMMMPGGWGSMRPVEYNGVTPSQQPTTMPAQTTGTVTK